MQFLVIIATFVAVVSCLPADVYKVEWEKFKVKFNRNYSAEEEDFRFKLFCRTLDIVTKHNKEYQEGKQSFAMGINNFADMTVEEKKRYLGIHRRGMAPEEYKAEWENFKVKFNRNYSPEEESFRFKLFCKTLDLVTKHNKEYQEGKQSFSMGINNFADMTEEEKKRYLGTHRRGTTPEQYKAEWENFKTKFHRQYATEKEEAHRFQVFCDNFDEITKHNEDYKKGTTSFKMGVNRFTDMTREEYIKFLDDQAGGHTFSPIHH